VQRQGAAADTRHCLFDLAADRSRKAFRAVADGLGGLAQHPQHGDLGERPFGVEVEKQRPFERGEAQLVDAQRTMEWMPSEAFDEICAPRDDPCLRAAEQLVAAEADEVGPRCERRACSRLVGEVEQRARPEVVDERQVAGACHGGELPE
jgi:hypothetical protein